MCRNRCPKKDGITMVHASTHNPKPAIAVAAFAAFLATFNETYLNVAFTPIMSTFGVGVPTVQWLATAYMLGAAVMVPVSAFAYRSLPTRRLFIATVALLVVGSLIGACAPSFPILLGARIIQSLGTGMLIPIGMNITLEVAPRERLGSYMGIMGAMTTLGPSSSVIGAGLLLAAFDWPVLLFVVAGLSLICLICGAIWLDDIAELTHPRLDPASVALVGLALIGLLYGISTVFTGPILVAAGSFVVGAVLLVVFLRRQRQLEHPLIDLRPLSIRPFTVGVILNMLALVAIFALNIVIPMFLQNILGLPSLTAALVLFPAIAASCVLSPVAGRFYDKHGARGLLIAGFAMIALFTAALSLIIANGSLILLAVVYLPVIGGSALIIGPVQSHALSHLTPDLNPHGVTVMSTGFQIAGCIGSSLMTGIYSGVTLASTSSGIDTIDAASTGFLAAGLTTVAFALVGFALSLRVKPHPAHPAHSISETSLDIDVRGIMKIEVYALSPSDTVATALRLLVNKGISAAPVVDASGVVVGFLSDGDIMRYLADQSPAFKNAWSFVVESHNDEFGQTLGELMALPVEDLASHRQVISVEADMDLGAVCKILTDHHLRKVPVLDQGRMVGIVNRSDISRYSVEAYFKGSGLPM